MWTMCLKLLRGMRGIIRARPSDQLGTVQTVQSGRDGSRAGTSLKRKGNWNFRSLIAYHVYYVLGNNILICIFIFC